MSQGLSSGRGPDAVAGGPPQAVVSGVYRGGAHVPPPVSTLHRAPRRVSSSLTLHDDTGPPATSPETRFEAFFPKPWDNVRSKSMRQCTIFANRIYSLCGPDTYRERSRSLHRDDKQHTHVVALVSEAATKCEYWIRNMCVTTERSRAG